MARLIKLCTECGVNEKEERANKYCKECRIKVKKRNMKNRKRGQKKLCSLCGVNYTGTKYCGSCAQKAIRRKAKENREIAKRKRHRMLFADIEIEEPKDMIIEEFEYSILKAKIIVDMKSYRAKNPHLVQESGSEKLLRRRAESKINDMIVGFRSGTAKQKLIAKQLTLEKEYIKEYERKQLMKLIEEKTGLPVGGSYSLAEIGRIFGISRERVRQLEDSALKILKHPATGKKLKYMIKD